MYNKLINIVQVSSTFAIKVVWKMRNYLFKMVTEYKLISFPHLSLCYQQKDHLFVIVKFLEHVFNPLKYTQY